MPRPKTHNTSEDSTVTPAVVPNLKTFAAALHGAMTRRNMNASDLAAAVWGRHDVMINGESRSVARNRDRISVYLAGKGGPKMNTLKAMATALEVSPEVLAPGVTHGRAVPAVSLRTLGGAQAGKMSLSANVVLPTHAALKIAAIIEENRPADASAAL